VKTAFLNSDLKHEIYIEFPEGFKTAEGFEHARLLKSIYGLKQAAHDWAEVSDSFIKNYDNCFTRSSIEPCMYYILTSKRIVIILVHVDDYLIASNDQKYVKNFVQAFQDKFGVNVLGKLAHFLQIAIETSKDTITLSQQRFIEELAERYHLNEIKDVHTPMDPTIKLLKEPELTEIHPYRNLLGSLMWLSRGTRPDIAFSVAYLSQFAISYSSEHFKALKRVLKYVITTKDKKLTFVRATPQPKIIVHSYTDSDWATDIVDRKSYSGSTVFVNGNLISWQSKKQKTVSTSSCEAEYVATSETVKCVLHLYYLLSEAFSVHTPVPVYLDNTGAAYLASNPVNNQRSKHIDIRVHHVRDWVKKKLIKIVKVPTADNTADLFTKALPRASHEKFTDQFLT
jgi:hypothetical protein